MNDSYRYGSSYRDSANLPSISSKSQVTKYPVSTLRRTQTTDLFSFRANRFSASIDTVNPMSTSYRDAYRCYWKSDNTVESKSNCQKRNEALRTNRVRPAYPANSSAGDRLHNPLGLPRHLSTESFGGAVVTKASAPHNVTPKPDPIPNGELSRLSLKETSVASTSKPIKEVAVAKITHSSIPSPSLSRIQPSSSESSPETVKSTVTSNSSNNSSAPRPSALARTSYVHEGYRNTALEPDRRSGGLVGLNNLGNTCFMNSIIQCLSNTQPLLDYALCGRYLDDKNPGSTMHGSLFASYASLMSDLWNPELADSSTSPHQFKTQIQRFAPRFVGYSQQDSQEFLRYLLEGLHIEVNRVIKRPPTVTPDYAAEDKLPEQNKAEIYWKRYLSMDNSEIVDLFVGQLMSTLECSECGFKSTTFDPFWDLSLPIPKKPNVNIVDCLRLFTSKDDLDGNERPVCGRCKARRRCSKSFSIQKFPRILVLHLKRFSGERFRSKMSVLVDFPIHNLNLSEFASRSCQQTRLHYNLYAVSNHSGSVYAGHYTATCKHPYRNTWYEYNDSRVRSTVPSSIVSPEAYVLFYELADQS